SFWLTDYPREGPLYEILCGGEDVWLHLDPDPDPEESLWFVSFYPYRRRPDLDANDHHGRIHVQDRYGEVYPFVPGAWNEDRRVHIKVPAEMVKALGRLYEKEDEVLALVRRHGVAWPSVPSPVAKVNRNEKNPTVTLEDGVTYAVSPEGAAVVDILIRN